MTHAFRGNGFSLSHNLCIQNERGGAIPSIFLGAHNNNTVLIPDYSNENENDDCCNDLKKQITSVRRSVLNLESIVSQKVHDHHILRKRVDQLETALSNLTGAVTIVEGDVTVLQGVDWTEIIALIHANLADHTNKLNDHGTLHDSHSDNLADHESTLGTHDTTLTTHGTTLLGHGDTLINHEARHDETQGVLGTFFNTPLTTSVL
jgi:hypothetical protein